MWYADRYTTHIYFFIPQGIKEISQQFLAVLLLVATEPWGTKYIVKQKKKTNMYCECIQKHAYVYVHVKMKLHLQEYTHTCVCCLLLTNMAENNSWVQRELGLGPHLYQKSMEVLSKFPRFWVNRDLEGRLWGERYSVHTCTCTWTT